MKYKIEFTSKDIDLCISKIANSDMESLRNLYNALKKPVFLFAFSLTQNYYVAEDVLQDTFIAIKLHADKYKSGTNARAWIYTIVRNECFNKMKKLKRNSKEDIDKVIDNSSFENEILGRIDIAGLLSNLDDCEREIVALHIFSGFSHRDIARIISKPYGSVRVKYSKALKKLKEHLKYLEGEHCEK